MRNFRTFYLAAEFYRACVTAKLPHHLKDQLLRSSSSVALNLAEGRGKRTAKEQRRFFDIAMGSLRESQAVLLLQPEIDVALTAMADKLGAHLFLIMKHAIF